MLKYIIPFLCAPLLLASCGQSTTTTTKQVATNDSSNNTPATVQQKENYTYHALAMKDSGMAKLKSNYDTNQVNIICALNRVDKQHLAKIDTIIIPNKVGTDILSYSIFPQSVPALKDVNKIIFFSYPAQAFGAYEHGNLVHFGTTNMGRQKDQTPTGLTYVNWKKEVDTSSVKDEWILKWDVNILNKGGVGFHEYDMPGYPASHSCLRLSDTDAHYLYNWVDQWKLKNANTVDAHGTPVYVFGAYPYGGRKPWLALAQNPHALDVSASFLQQLTASELQAILAEQQKLAALQTAK